MKTAAFRLRAFDIAACLAGPLAIALVAVALGQSTSWDLRNYHWYNAYALLHGRYGVDIAVAHHATYYNPLIDLPLWWWADAVPGWAAAAGLGLVQGLNASVLYLLARDVLTIASPLRRRLAALALAALGVTGGYALSLTGAAHYDNVVSVPLLFAVWLLVRRCDHAVRSGIDSGTGPEGAMGERLRSAWPAFALAGLLTGAAVGLKLPMAPFGLGIIAAALGVRSPDAGGLVARSASRAARNAAVTAATAALGLLLTGGWWAWELWRQTGNPLFPYFNDAIGSSLLLDASYRDARFLPRNIVDAVLFPIRASLDWRVSADGPVVDWRIAFAYVLVPVACVLRWSGRDARDPLVAPMHARVLYAYAAAAYAAWLAVFAIYRYLTPLEMLAPLLIAAAIGAWPLARRARALMTAAAFAAMLAAGTLAIEPRPPFASKMIDVDVPRITRPDRTLALMAGVEPTAFVIPAFPRQIAFLRIEGYLAGPGQWTPLLQRMLDRIDAHRRAGGDLFVLYVDWERDRAANALQQVGLRMTDDCVDVRNNLETQLQWCRVEPGIGNRE